MLLFKTIPSRPGWQIFVSEGFGVMVGWLNERMDGYWIVVGEVSRYRSDQVPQSPPVNKATCFVGG